jgi:hypothetical protein
VAWLHGDILKKNWKLKLKRGEVFILQNIGGLYRWF